MRYAHACAFSGQQKALAFGHATRMTTRARSAYFIQKHRVRVALKLNAFLKTWQFLKAISDIELGLVIVS